MWHLLVCSVITVSFLIELSISECFKQLKGKNGTASFNICPLMKDTIHGQLSYYKVFDERYYVNQSTPKLDYYEYVFNIGRSLFDNIPMECKNNTKDQKGYCKNNIMVNDTCKELVPFQGISYAYQLKRNNSGNHDILDCWRLSNSFGGPPEWSLINDNNPTDGFKLRYLNGDWDPSQCKKNREFEIRFLCENTYTFPEKEHLFEDNCWYSFDLRTIYGCPTECGRSNDLCSNNGLCGFDYSTSKPKCFCYHNYTGVDCSQKDLNPTNIDHSKKKPPDMTSKYVHAFNVSHSKHNKPIEVIYDLTDFNIGEGVYVVDDVKNGTYVYHIGLLHTVGSITNCKIQNLDYTRAPCLKMSDINNTCLEYENIDYSVNNSYVFQIEIATQQCWILGTVPTWNLYDVIDDAAKGVSITFDNGSYCQSIKQNRYFTMSFVCPDDNTADYYTNIETEIRNKFFVQENDVCGYELVIESALACPYQCKTPDPINDQKFYVCSAHGICAADPSIGFVRCLCDEQHEGNDCGGIISPNPTFNPTNAPSFSPTTKPTKQPTNSPTLSTTTAKPKVVKQKDSNGGYIAGIVILIIAMIAGLGLFYWCYKGWKMKHQSLESQLQKDSEYGRMLTTNNDSTKTKKGGFEKIDITKADHDIDDDTDDTDDNINVVTEKD